MATLLSNQIGTNTQNTGRYNVWGRVWLDSQDARNNKSYGRFQLVNRYHTGNGTASWQGNYAGGAFIRVDGVKTDWSWFWGSPYDDGWKSGLDGAREYVMLEQSFELAHDSNGNKTVNLWMRCNAPAGGSGPGDCYVKSSGYAWDVTLPAIDRAAPTVTNSVVSVTTNSVTVEWGANTSCDALQHSIGNGWVDTSGYPRYTVSGLAANTSYAITTRARKESNWVWGAASTLYFQTHPNTVGCKTPSASATGPFQIMVSVTSTDTANTSMIRVFCGNLYKDISGGSGTVYFDVSPETQYKIYGKAYTVRSGATSDSSPVYVTTPADSFCYVINENGSKTGKHKMYLIDTNGTKTEVKKGNVKVL